MECDGNMTISTSKLISINNPMSIDLDEEFNRWYNNVHIPEVMSLPNICGVTRYRAKTQLRPSSRQAPYLYFNIYDLIEPSAVAKEIMGKEAHFSPSDAIDLDGTISTIYEPFFTFTRK